MYNNIISGHIIYIGIEKAYLLCKCSNFSSVKFIIVNNGMIVCEHAVYKCRYLIHKI